MDLQVISSVELHRLRRADGGDLPNLELVNGFLVHLRRHHIFTRDAYAYDLLDFVRFLRSPHALFADVVPTDRHFNHLRLAMSASPVCGSQV